MKCFERNGPITGYRYRLYVNHTHFFSDKVEVGVILPIKVSFSSKTTVLAISVAAINIAGVGPYSEPIGMNQNVFEKGWINLCTSTPYNCCTLIVQEVHVSRSMVVPLSRDWAGLK